MHKYLAIVILMLISGNAQAHSHPAVDALTHALEHTAMLFADWQPDLLGLSLVVLLGAFIQVRRNRAQVNRRSSL